MMFGYKDVFSYFQCAQCECLQIAEIPRNIAKYYEQGYYAHQPLPVPGPLKRAAIKLRNEYAVFNQNIVGKFLHQKHPNDILQSLAPLRLTREARILDVGCGMGRALRALFELGFKNNLGIDPFIKEDITSPNGPVILKKNIREIQDKWDVVMFHHSLEHIPDPQKTLEKVSGILAENGSCVVRIPIASSYAWRHYGVNWVQLDAPRHFFLHSIKSMQIMAKRAQLDLYRIDYDSFAFQFWGSEQYKLGISHMDPRSYAINPKNSIFPPKKIAEFATSAKQLNEAKDGDQAVFYLKKIKNSPVQRPI